MDSAITLKAESQQALLHFARDTVQNQCLSAHAPSPSRALRAQIPARAGAFVTLKIGKALRGCIGTFDANRALVDVVHEMAIAASTRDPRFHPVRKEELAQLHFAISVLGPPRPVVSLEEIVVGRHGLIVGLGRQRGVLLAKVPVEYGWDRDEFLSMTCQKAGLPQQAWRSFGETGLTIELFETFDFEEP